MAALPPIKRFVQEDFNGLNTISAFASKLFYPLNRFLNAVYSALNHGLTLNQNTIGMVLNQPNVKADANGVVTTTINWPYLQSPPQGVVVLNCSVNGAGVLLPLHSWSYASGVVSISMQFIKSSAGSIVISASQTYSVTFWVSAG